MSHTPQNIFKAWQNGQIVYAEDLVQEREILRVASNDTYARVIKQYRVLNADGSTKTIQNLDVAINTLRFRESDSIQITLDNATSTLTFEVVDGSVDTPALADGSVTTIKVADLAITAQKIANGTITLDKLDLTSLDSRYYTESEVDTKLSTKTDKLGDHEGTWQGLNPIDFDTGEQAQDIDQLKTDVVAAQTSADNAQQTANSHASRHASGGPDAITPASIGAETIQGSQNNAVNALTAANIYTDTQLETINSERITIIPYRTATASGNDIPLGITTFATPAGTGGGIDDGYPFNLVNVINIKNDNSRVSQFCFNSGGGSGTGLEYRIWRSDTGWSTFEDILTMSAGDSRYARTGAPNTFTSTQTFDQPIYAEGGFPLFFIGANDDTTNKRNYRWDISGDRLRLQAINDSLAYVRGIFELDFDGNVFNHNNSPVWKNSNNILTTGVNGRLQLANGLFLQWGRSGNITPETSTRIVFPVAFSASPMTVVATVDANEAASVSVGAGTNTGINVTHNHPDDRPIMWYAIGVV